MERLGSSYILEERIGTGAQGDVYRGRIEGSEELLAFKLLRSELTRERTIIDAFLKERDNLQRVDSPFVVRLRDMVVEGQSLALVMDYVGGGDLSDLLRNSGTLTPAMVARIGAAVASGLGAIHAAGLVHRDVKPANVLLDNATQPPTPRVADFGVARICDSAGATHSTGGVGTPLYMAPEVADGVVATPATDMYSLGVVLYELTCGVTPFVGTPIALIKAHGSLVPGRPEGLPDPLWQLIEVLLSKDPLARPSAVQTFEHLVRLEPMLAGLPAAPRLTTPPPGRPVSPAAQTQLAGAPLVAHSAGAGSAPEAPARKKRSFVIVAALLSVLFVGGGAFAATKLLSGGDGGPGASVAATPSATAEPTVTASEGPTKPAKATASSTPSTPSTMPDLTGLTEAQAKAKLPAGVNVSVEKVGAPNKEKPGTVLSSDPAAGSLIPDKVTLKVATAMETIYLADLKRIGFDDLNNDVVNLSGKTYAHGVYVRLYNQSSPRNGEWNLGRYFTTLNGTLGMTDNSDSADATFTVDFYLDQVLVQTEEVKFGEFKDISLDVRNSLRLKVVVTRTDKKGNDSAAVGFGDFQLQGEPDKVPDLKDLNGQG